MIHAASVAIFHSQEILLIQRALPPFAGFWTLPGGRLEPGESAMAGALREIHEELGLRLHKLVPVTQLQVSDAYQLIVFAARMPPQIVRPSDEIADFRWVMPDAMDHLQTTPGLAEVFAAVKNKSLTLEQLAC